MAGPSVAAAGVVASLFLLLLVAALASFRLTKFRIYLLLGVSLSFRGVGYALRAADIDSPADGLGGSYLALTSAGYGISLAVICLLLGCWWKNSAAGAGLRQLSIYSRLLIAPIILLGPIGGCVLAGLIYGAGPGVLPSANRLRHAIVWGMLAILIVLLLITLLGAYLAWRAQQALRRQQAAKGVPLTQNPDLLVLVMSTCSGLLLISASFRVAASYHSSLSADDNKFYSIQVLPELLEAVLLLLPKLMPRAALGRGFAGWWQQTHGGALEAFIAAAPESAVSEASAKQSKHAEDWA